MKSEPSGSFKKYVPPGAEVLLLAVEARELVQELADRLQAFPSSLVHLGQGAMAALLLQGLRDSETADATVEEKVELQWKCEGPFGSLYADSFGLGRVRVAITDAHAEVQDLKTGLGPGLFQVRRVFENKNLHPFTGIVQAKGHVGEDLVEYLEKSEQKTCGVSLSVKLGWDDSRKENPIRVQSAEAYLVHILPQNDETKKDQLVAAWDRHMSALGPLSQWALPEEPTEVTNEIYHFLTGRPTDKSKIAWEKQISLFCPCTQERAERALALLSMKEKEELKATPRDGALTLSCEYCGTEYKTAV